MDEHHNKQIADWLAIIFIFGSLILLATCAALVACAIWWMENNPD
jgi:hypothetical protein